MMSTESSHVRFGGSWLNEVRGDGVLCDVVLHVDGKDFPTHKLVLSAASPVFRTMFTEAESPANADILDATPEVFRGVPGVPVYREPS